MKNSINPKIGMKILKKNRYIEGTTEIAFDTLSPINLYPSLAFRKWESEVNIDIS